MVEFPKMDFLSLYRKTTGCLRHTTAGVLPIVTYLPLFDVNSWWPHLQDVNMRALHFHLLGIRRQQVSQNVSSNGEFGFSCNLDSLEITSCKIDLRKLLSLGSPNYQFCSYTM